jgi:hypothetical protein
MGVHEALGAATGGPVAPAPDEAAVEHLHAPGHRPKMARGTAGA